MKRIICLILVCLSFGSLFAQEKHLRNIQKLTFGGDNAEAYFSPNGQMLTMQVTNVAIGAACDQIYLLDLQKQPYTTASLQRVSTGKGRTTCSYFLPDGKHILYASTHAAADACPPPPKPRSDGKYLWAIYPEFDIYIADLQGNITKRLTDSPGYDAEAVVSPDGKKIAFTSTRSGDLELWTMNLDGTNLKQITFGLGYDGGSFFSHDSKKLVFRASRPKTEKDIADYKALLAENLVAPTDMDIYTCNVDGSDLRQITNLGKANWAPFFHPNDKRIIFSSNHHSTRGYDFQLYSIDTDGNNLEQITFESNFNAFPMFSPDGKKLVFSSNRQQDAPRETNVFIADWVEGDENERVQLEQLKKHLTFLASDKLGGRMTGTEGEKMAADYIQKQFKSYKLQGFEKNNYLQAFDYQFSANPHATNGAKEEYMKGTNVVGFLDNKADKTIVIGAHYDHLGHNEHRHSTLPNSVDIHNGADDNASGVAGILELARMLSQNRTIEKVNYVFVAFSGEEDGLRGSKAFAEIVKSKYPNVIAMINMDMIGRLDSMKSLTVGGIGTSPIFYPLLEKNKPAGVNITVDSSGVGPTDHTSFYQKNLPVLNFFTGTHLDYHKPSDDVEKINFAGEKLVLEYIFRLLTALEVAKEIPFTPTKVNAGRSAPKYKVSLGVMPDYTNYGDGLHLEAVIQDRAAEKAGMEAGDIITKIGDCDIKDVYSYMDCLAKLKAGDEVEVTFKHKGEIKTAKVKM